MKKHRQSTYIKRIQEALSIDLLHPKYKRLVDPLKHPTTGHCYIATKAAYFIFGKENGYIPYMKNTNGVEHWWLKNESNGNIIDVTELQLESKFNYDLGKKGRSRARFLDERTKELIRRVKRVIE